jgi:hypothetical protein
MAKLLDERDIAEDAEVANHQHEVVPHLVWRLAIECLSRQVVEQVNSDHDLLTPIDGRHPPLLEEGMSGGHHRLVAALDDAILLRSVRRGVEALDALVGVVRRELSRHELAAVVRAQDTKLATTLLLHSGLMMLDGIRSSCLGVEDDRLHVAGDVVDKEEEVTPASMSSPCDGAVEVAMHKLHFLLGTEARLVR